MAEETTDVAVIGAGIIGASCAYQLAARGLRVVVLEMDIAPAMGSTGKSAAGVRVQFTTAPNIRMSKLSLDIYRNFPARHGLEVGYQPIGYLLLVPPARWEAHLEAVALQRRLEVPVDVLAVDEAQRYDTFDPDGLAGATFGPIDGVVDPHLATHAFVTLGRAQRVDYRLEHRVREVERPGTGWRLSTGADRFTAGCVVNAAGPWAGEVAALAGLSLPVQPMRRQVYVSVPIDDPRTYPLTIDLATGFYLRSEGRRVLFGLSNESEVPGFHDGMDEAWIETTLLTGVQRFPWFEELGVDLRAAWCGYYEVSPDRNPIIGRHPATENWIDAGGFSGHGIMHAPATGLLVAELVADGAAHTLDLAPYSHRRFAAGESGDANIF